MYAVSPVVLMEIEQFFFLFEVFWCVSIIPTKLSISFMLMRIAGPKKMFVQSLWVVSALFTIMNMIAFFYIIFECTPVSCVFLPHLRPHLKR